MAFEKNMLLYDAGFDIRQEIKIDKWTITDGLSSALPLGDWLLIVTLFTRYDNNDLALVEILLTASIRPNNLFQPNVVRFLWLVNDYLLSIWFTIYLLIYFCQTLIGLWRPSSIHRNPCALCTNRITRHKNWKVNKKSEIFIYGWVQMAALRIQYCLIFLWWLQCTVKDITEKRRWPEHTCEQKKNNATNRSKTILFYTTSIQRCSSNSKFEIYIIRKKCIYRLNCRII